VSELTEKPGRAEQLPAFCAHPTLVVHARDAAGGHAVCVVGYTTDKRFIIRNSWGTLWGDKGFAYASEAYINAGFYNESYGVAV
jgi:C1A family cysteine protease